MTKYQIDRQGIFMVQVRALDSKHEWSVTGPNWFFRRKDAIASITPNPWPHSMEYRVVRYLPKEQSQ